MVDRRHSCPRCRYDLRGHFSSWADTCPLRTLCPECGFEFPTGDLLARPAPGEPIRQRSAPGWLVTTIFFLTGFGVIAAVVWLVVVVW